MSYKGLSLAANATAPHLGGNVKAGDPFTYCASVWNYVIARFAIHSVMDLGSGCGNAADYFYKKGLKVVAIEGLAENVQLSLYPAVKHDLTSGPVITKVDLVHCQEVVEHIDAQYIDNLMDSFLSGRIILMTHALPGQGGHHHVNEQPAEYWINQFERRGCSLLDEDSLRVRQLAANDRATYMAASGLLFANNSRI